MGIPFFSVVIPTHNRSLLLKRAINSVLNQTYANFEIIIVDDHSTDDTAKMVEKFKDSRVQYTLNQRKKGACGARNTGIFAAKGEWVAFLDDDDIWFKEKLQKQHELISTSAHEVGLVCSDYIIIDGNKEKIIKNRPFGQNTEKILYGGFIGCLSSNCIKFEVLEEINGFDESFPSNQDLDLWIRISNIAEYSSVPQVLVQMYQENRKDRIGNNFKKKLEGWVLLKIKHSQLIKNNWRIRQKVESSIFSYSLVNKELKSIFLTLPWLLFSAVTDFKSFLKTITFTLKVMWLRMTHYTY